MKISSIFFYLFLIWVQLLSTLAVLDQLNLVDLFFNCNIELWHQPQSYTVQASTLSGFGRVFAHTHLGHNSGEYVPVILCSTLMKTHTSKVWNMGRVTLERADVCLVIKREKGQVMEIAAVAEQATVIYWVQFALLSFFSSPNRHRSRSDQCSRS